MENKLLKVPNGTSKSYKKNIPCSKNARSILSVWHRGWLAGWEGRRKGRGSGYRPLDDDPSPPTLLDAKLFALASSQR
ncbi:hypothetical protein CEXT_549681 [Caerostris extrusa]|uniref:Uncharacterized protein n=1 Tax=Caerostris extrusa TaxID=172846 RepID=A0AAV4PR49_CAEEX|nr:hypothetical protein CEXT_549681 [Caerostris extrusa]